MRMPKIALTVVAASLLLAACNQAPKTDPAADEAAVRAVNAAWAKAYVAGDAAGVAAGYADDAVLNPPEAPAVRGAAAIREYVAKDVAATQAAGLKYEADPNTDVGVSGDLAWETGSFRLLAADGSPVGSGKFVSVLARRDGGWKLIRDTYNMDAPPAEPAGGALRIARFTATSADAQQAAIALADGEITAAYRSAPGFRWVKYFADPKTLETGSVSLWSSVEEIEAFVKSDAYKPIPGKLKPLMKGSMATGVYPVHVAPKQ